jgi:wyosine [tRNA(Phe)-imidazoG37] synthetase (radical SAM superfamily)
MKLSDHRHDRDVAGFTYVYPVVSRRSRGVSVGINLSPNHACNWRCIYCQVPDLILGKAPPIDLDLLGRELHEMLHALVHGDYLERRVPEGSRRINDIAFSGNGEPTASPHFLEAVEVATEVIAGFEELAEIKLVLITNGSLLHRDRVQRGLERMAKANGEIWFKFDSATAEGRSRTNGTKLKTDRVAENLRIATGIAPTWLQTMAFLLDDEPPSESEVGAYLGFCRGLLQEGLPLRGVLLYGIAREPRGPEAARLARLDDEPFHALAERIRSTGLEVRAYP